MDGEHFGLNYTTYIKLYTASLIQNTWISELIFIAYIGIGYNIHVSVSKDYDFKRQKNL